MGKERTKLYILIILLAKLKQQITIINLTCLYRVEINRALKKESHSTLNNTLINLVQNTGPPPLNDSRKNERYIDM